MGFVFSKPKQPPPPVIEPLPPLPTRDDPEVAAARERERLARGRARGRKATILSSPLGTPSPQVKRRAAFLGDVTQSSTLS